MSEIIRPRPASGIYEKLFWEAVQKREFRLQRCRSCGHVWYPPGPVCPECLADNWEMALMSGKGRVIAWTVFHRQYFPNMPVPYLVVSVATDEGPLMIGNIIGADVSATRLDLPVHVEFEPAKSDDGEWIIMQWAPD
jgi:uncharacterized OB-fold protein